MYNGPIRLASEGGVLDRLEDTSPTPIREQDTTAGGTHVSERG